jgi:hypothetical protein
VCPIEECRVHCLRIRAVSRAIVIIPIDISHRRRSSAHVTKMTKDVFAFARVNFFVGTLLVSQFRCGRSSRRSTISCGHRTEQTRSIDTSRLSRTSSIVVRCETNTDDHRSCLNRRSFIGNVLICCFSSLTLEATHRVQFVSIISACRRTALLDLCGFMSEHTIRFNPL